MPSEIGIMRTAFPETRRTLSSCRGARPRAPSPPPLHSGWHASDGHAPYALDPPPPEDLSPPEAWRLRDGAVLRAHDGQPHVDEVCLALTWRSFLGCDFCYPNRGCRAREKSLSGGPRCSAIDWSRQQERRPRQYAIGPVCAAT